MEAKNRREMTDTSRVYVADGDIATELRAKVDISPGQVLLQEAAFAFAREDDDDDAALPSIVQVAMNALVEVEENEAVISETRQWKDLMTEDCTDCDYEDDAQKKALFAWGAQQILSRLADTNSGLALKIEENDAIEAIRRVSLNAFTVKRIDPTAGREQQVQLDTIVDDFDLVRAVMQIGKEEIGVGNGLYITASAANHSCSPNAYTTFDANNNITFRATESIKANEAVTISYGPVVGVDGNFLERRSEILASRTHGFVCNCKACVAEEARAIIDDDDDHEDLEATNFIETYITSGTLTAEEALLKSRLAPTKVMKSRLFRQAMSDTSMQSISYDIDMALEFQKIALKSLEMRCDPREDIAIAYEIVTLSLLRLFSEEKQADVGNECGRARTILSRYYGEEYAYKQILDALASAV